MILLFRLYVVKTIKIEFDTKLLRTFKLTTTCVQKFIICLKINEASEYNWHGVGLSSSSSSPFVIGLVLVGINGLT